MRSYKEKSVGDKLKRQINVTKLTGRAVDTSEQVEITETLFCGTKIAIKFCPQCSF